MTAFVERTRAMGESTECGLAVLHTFPLLRHSERSEESRARRGFWREAMRVFVADAVRSSGRGIPTSPPLRRHSERSEESRARWGLEPGGTRSFVAETARPPGLGVGESLLEARFFAHKRMGFRKASACRWGRTSFGDHWAEAAQNDGVGLVFPVQGAARGGQAVLADFPTRRVP